MLPDMLESLDDHALMLRYGSDGDVAAFEAEFGFAPELAIVVAASAVTYGIGELFGTAVA